ncbi:uncharacterized protein LOC134270666 [Saccostrea cucullata]|uniref:uncharacterized protein LOC134270666 n=1 Tax=Saccostrea cuccullata TaxID=36930 RepID=UPI002ED4B8DC
MMKKSVFFSFYFIFLFQLLKVYNIFSQGLYEDRRKFQGPFTENLKENVCTESIKTCGVLLNVYQTMHRFTTGKLVEVQQSGTKNENTVSLYKNRSRTCQLQLKEMEMNVSESLNAIDSLSKLNLNADLKLQELQLKMKTKTNKMLSVNKSLSFCEKKLDGCTFNLANTSLLLRTTNETIYRAIEKMEQKSLELNAERAKVDAINNSLKQCNKVLMEVYSNVTDFSEALRLVEKTVLILKNESLRCNLILNDTLSNLNETSIELQSSEMEKQNCLNLLEIQNKTKLESFHKISKMNNSLNSCEHSLDICRGNISKYKLNMSLTELRHLEMISSQKTITQRLKNEILGLATLNDSLQRCEENLQVALRNLSEYDVIISTMNTNLSTAISSCSNETSALEERLQNCESSLESTTKDFSELEIQAKRNNVTCTETQRLLKKKTEEFERNLTEYKSLLDKLKSVPKKSWTVDDLCRNLPNFVFEDKELCPSFYDCSQSSPYLQQCPYPQLFSDINARCQDPSTVNCGERNITYGYTCDFESLSDSNCFLVNSGSGIFSWTRHTGSTSSSDTGPSSAYHGSYYMYIEASSPRKYGDNAVLESNKRFQDKIYCLSLFYHMRGSNIGRLIIKTENSSYGKTVLKQITGEQGNTWQKMDSLNVSVNRNTKILIEATRGSSYEGDISIDLVTLWPRKC